MCLTKKILTHVRYNNAQVYAPMASCFVLNCVSIVDIFTISITILSFIFLSLLAGGILQILQSDLLEERAVCYHLAC